MPKPPAAFSPLMIDEVELPVAHKTRQALDDRAPAAATDDVADEKNAHPLRLSTVDDLALR